MSYLTFHWKYNENILHYLTNSSAKISEQLLFSQFLHNLCFSFSRKLKGPGIPTTVLRYAPDSCDVYVVARDRTISKLADSSSSQSCGTVEKLPFYDIRSGAAWCLKLLIVCPL